MASTRIFDASVYIALDDSMNSSSSDYHVLMVDGDTIRIGQQRTISSAISTGYAGEICHDSNYLYICTATNTWKRTALSTW